jgi:hypothetical protein
VIARMAPVVHEYCECGCGCAARPGSRFASSQCSNKHRRKTWDEYHPRLDLSGLPLDVAKRCLRMAEEAVKAARQGLERCTVDSRAPVTHQRDPRPSCRLRLSPTVFSILDEMAGDGWGGDGSSRSSVAETMILKEYDRWKGGARGAQENS